MSITHLDLSATFYSYRFIIVFGVPTRAPGSNLIEIPYTGYDVLNSNVDLTTIEYSLDGVTFSTATPNNVGETTNLTFSTDGMGQIFTWKAFQDIGNSMFNTKIYFRIKAQDALYSSALSLTSFTITKTTTSSDTRNSPVFSSTYRGVPGTTLVKVLKPTSR